MPSTPFEVIVFALARSCEMVALAILWRRSHLRAMPFLATFLAASFLAAFTRAALVEICAKSSWLPFDFYWGWCAIVGVLRTLVLIDIARSFPGYRIVPVKLVAFITSFALVVAALSGVVAFRQETAFHRAWWKTMMDVVTGVDRAVAMSGLAVLALLLATVFVLRLGWSRRGALLSYAIATTFASSMLGNILTSMMGSRWRSAGGVVASSLAVGAQIVCAISVSLKEEAYELPSNKECILPQVLCESPVEEFGQ